MSNKIEISKEYFLKHLVERLRVMYESLGEVDEALHGNDEFKDEWIKVRETILEIDELIDALD